MPAAIPFIAVAAAAATPVLGGIAVAVGVSTVVAGVIVGAVVGAVVAAATGENILTGALMGGLSGFAAESVFAPAAAASETTGSMLAAQDAGFASAGELTGETASALAGNDAGAMLVAQDAGMASAGNITAETAASLGTPTTGLLESASGSGLGTTQATSGVGKDAAAGLNNTAPKSGLLESTGSFIKDNKELVGTGLQITGSMLEGSAKSAAEDERQKNAGGGLMTNTRFVRGMEMKPT